MVKGLANAHAADLIGARGEQPCRSVTDVWQRAGVPVAALERIAEADGFLRVGLDRRQALWEIRGLADSRLPLFAAADEAAEPGVALPPMPQGGEVVEDYRSVGLSLRRHPVSFLRDELTRERILPCAALAELRDGARATVAGVILVRQRPGSASGVLFITIEDETGHANLIVWPSVFERQRRLVMSASMLACRGKVQKEGEVIHVIADHLTDFSPAVGQCRPARGRNPSMGGGWRAGVRDAATGHRPQQPPPKKKRWRGGEQSPIRMAMTRASGGSRWRRAIFGRMHVPHSRARNLCRGPTLSRYAAIHRHQPDGEPLWRVSQIRKDTRGHAIAASQVNGTSVYNPGRGEARQRL